MRIVLVVLVLTLVSGFSGCKRASRDQQAAALMKEANNLLAQSTKATEGWATPYGKAFTPQNRAKFPANREWLRGQADNIIKHLNEQERLSNEAIAKYEQATELISNEQQRRGTSVIVSALKNGVKVDGLLRSQMQLVSDETIVNEKTFNERFLRIHEQIVQIRREIDSQFVEGKRLLGV